MRINPDSIIHQIAALRPRAIASTPKAGPAADQLSISAFARDLQTAMEALRELPAVDEETVARLRSRLERGTLIEDASALAARLLENARAAREADD